MSKKILLEFREQDYKDLLKWQQEAETAIKPLVAYCEETLDIEVQDLQTFLRDPKAYCIDAFWEKFGAQYKGTPIKKEKVISLTGWSDAAADMHIKNAKAPFSKLAKHQYRFIGKEIKFSADPEDFKTYVREEDEDLYELAEEFIEVAEKMEARGGKPAWYLARYYGILAVEGEKLIPSTSFFKATERTRKVGLIGSFMA